MKIRSVSPHPRWVWILWLKRLMYIYIYSIVAFVKGDQPKQFPTLQVRYKKGANPTLKLLDDTNTVQDTLA